MSRTAAAKIREDMKGPPQLLTAIGGVRIILYARNPKTGEILNQQLAEIQDQYGIKSFSVTISARGDDSDVLGSHSRAGLTLSVEQLLGPNPFPDAVTFHEIKHALNALNLKNGVEGPYYASAKAEPGQVISSFKGYEKYFSVDEISAYKDTVERAEKGLDIDVLFVREGFLIRSREQLIKHRAQQMKNASLATLDLIKNARTQFLVQPIETITVIKPDGKNHFQPRVVIPLFKAGVKVGTFEIYLIGLNTATNENIEELLLSQLNRMEQAAKADLTYAIQKIDSVNQ